MYIRREVIDKIGVFDTRFFGFWSDIDYGIRVQRAGWRHGIAAGAWLYHFGKAAGLEPEATGGEAVAKAAITSVEADAAYAIFRRNGLPPSREAGRFQDAAMSRPSGRPAAAGRRVSTAADDHAGHRQTSCEQQRGACMSRQSRQQAFDPRCICTQGARREVARLCEQILAEEPAMRRRFICWACRACSGASFRKRKKIIRRAVEIAPNERFYNTLGEASRAEADRRSDRALPGGAGAFAKLRGCDEQPVARTGGVRGVRRRRRLRCPRDPASAAKREGAINSGSRWSNNGGLRRPSRSRKRRCGSIRNTNAPT